MLTFKEFCENIQLCQRCGKAATKEDCQICDTCIRKLRKSMQYNNHAAADRNPYEDDQYEDDTYDDIRIISNQRVKDLERDSRMLSREADREWNDLKTYLLNKGNIKEKIKEILKRRLKERR
jgi:hypothetical protein